MNLPKLCNINYIILKSFKLYSKLFKANHKIKKPQISNLQLINRCYVLEAKIHLKINFGTLFLQENSLIDFLLIELVKEYT